MTIKLDANRHLPLSFQVALAESAELSATQQHLEREIASARAMSRQALLASESKVETLKMEYVNASLSHNITLTNKACVPLTRRLRHDKVVHNVTKLREDTINAIIQQTEYIIKFKEAAGETLEGLKRFAELN